jgi:hypothetical protein
VCININYPQQRRQLSIFRAISQTVLKRSNQKQQSSSFLRFRWHSQKKIPTHTHSIIGEAQFGIIPMKRKQYIPAISVGKHIQYKQCRFCSTNITPFIDFGYVPLAGDFFSKKSSNTDFLKKSVYPLQICFCPHCYLVQCNTSVDSDILFKDYYYSSSSIKTLVNYFEILAHDLTLITASPKRSLVVEIGCNDGVLLRPLLIKGFPLSTNTLLLKKRNPSVLRKATQTS